MLSLKCSVSCMATIDGVDKGCPQVLYCVNGKSLLPGISGTTMTTMPSRSSTAIHSDNQTRFKTWFKPPIQLDKKKDYEIALINLETYYSFQNIDRSNNCFTYTPVANALWYDIIIPEGSYHVDDINELFNEKCEKMVTMIKQTIRITLKYLLIPTH